MLAIKLHDERRPLLGVGSHLIPFVNGDQGRAVLGNWARTLIGGKWLGRDCNISLVKIGDSVAVFLSPDRFATKFAGFHPKAPDFKESLGQVAKPLREWDKAGLCELHWAPGLEWMPEPSWKKQVRPNGHTTLHCEVPEIILAEALPQSAVKWTKRFRLWRQRG